MEKWKMQIFAPIISWATVVVFSSCFSIDDDDYHYDYDQMNEQTNGWLVDPGRFFE